MQSGEERREERRTGTAEEQAREASEGRRAQGAHRDRERAEMARLAAELLIDQAERHHRQRPVVGLPRHGAAVLDPVQRLAESSQRLPSGLSRVPAAIAPSSSHTKG